MQTTFGQQLDRAMRAAGFHKQLALEQATGMSQSTISRLLNDEYKPKLEQLDALAKACGVNRYALIGGTAIAGDYPSDCFATLNPEASTDDSTKWLAYYASALTNLSDDQQAKVFADAEIVRKACEQIRAFLYEPRFYTHPVFNKAVPAETVYKTDHSQVSVSNFIVLHAGHPSFGAGQELEIAKNAGIPVVLLQPRGVSVSRMVLGTCARLHQVHFGNDDELRAAITACFEPLVTDLLHRNNNRIPAQAEPLGFSTRLHAARTAMKIDEEVLSRLVGVQKQAIENFENGADENPSLVVLTRMAAITRTTVAHLVEGAPNRIEDRDPVFRESFTNLLEFAKANNVGYDDVGKLWDAEDTSYRKHRRAVAEARSAAVTVAGWKERLERLKTGSVKPRQARLGGIDD